MTVIDRNLEAQVSALKRREEGELQVHGSGELGHTLLAAGLVDQLRLVIALVVLGQGRRLFGETTGPLGLKLLAWEATPSGLSLARYGFTGAAGAGVYVRGVTDRNQGRAAGSTSRRSNEASA